MKSGRFTTSPVKIRKRFGDATSASRRANNRHSDLQKNFNRNLVLDPEILGVTMVSLSHAELE
jgi:hypothetical protein